MLVVDDEASITRTLALILHQAGFTPIPAHSAEEAVKLAREYPPDCVICDIVMGTMNGIEAAIQIRALCPECRIVLMSGHSTAADLLEAHRARGLEFDVLAKPFHPSVLLKRLSA